ncbi:MAG: hypothetical protein EOO15_03030 [Chitinophagaceae bacterium]|nr:MAG: hypothetical protein EOO15_03030 [Chitinophagaceae bacterium]
MEQSRTHYEARLNRDLRHILGFLERAARTDLSPESQYYNNIRLASLMTHQARNVELAIALTPYSLPPKIRKWAREKLRTAPEANN